MSVCDCMHVCCLVEHVFCLVGIVACIPALEIVLKVMKHPKASNPQKQPHLARAPTIPEKSQTLNLEDPEP